MQSVKFTKQNRDWLVPDAFYRISIKAIITNDQNQLLVLRDITESSEEGGGYELPGGGLDWGETEHETLQRELREELNLKNNSIGSAPIAYVYGQHPKGYRTLKIYYRVKINGTPKDNEPDSLTHEWVSKKQFAKLQMPGDESGIREHLDSIFEN